MKFNTLAFEWFESKEKYVKESTKAYYMYELQHYILPALGEIEVATLTENIIQKIVCKWQTENNSYNKIIKKSTISNLVMLIRQIIKYGIKQKYLSPFDPEILYLPETYETKNKTFSNEKQKNCGSCNF